LNQDFGGAPRQRRPNLGKLAQGRATMDCGIEHGVQSGHPSILSLALGKSGLPKANATGKVSVRLVLLLSGG
jgi:hypothetical protein